MGSSSTASSFSLSCPCGWVIPNSSPAFLKPSTLRLRTPLHTKITYTQFLKTAESHLLGFYRAKARATLDEKEQNSTNPLVVQEERHNRDVEESVEVLKNAAKTRRVAAEKVVSALSVIEKAKLDSSGFLETLGGSESPGRTWMLIFTATKQLNGGSYFPLTAVQRFDAAAKRIENGVYLGPIGSLTFEGRFSWKKRVLAFIFECIRIKVGPFKPLEVSLGQKGNSEPSTNNPFFIWFYVDEEIAVARGRSGGTAFWCRCRRVKSY
ncbi:uncharacterized protein LOC131163207 isoform X2 [Malania oleifera]|uniref:uncharacterized protein LOC131163207 isoform X2 n=1 Tax=Malania oleifera TaxID=397392 RepID=UPI0025ADDA1E|nr:uncharacterized protein LOC131163207 isoform X2 [Malania oleifera]